MCIICKFWLFYYCVNCNLGLLSKIQNEIIGTCLALRVRRIRALTLQYTARSQKGDGFERGIFGSQNLFHAFSLKKERSRFRLLHFSLGYNNL